jgi:ABC-type antimicrobial peptide transport system permease subunit
MRGAHLARRSLRHFWRTNAAVVLGVATAVAVLSGSLVVGASVRASLADLALARLGRTHAAVTSSRPLREALGQPDSPPLLALRGSVARQDGTRRASDVLVYGVDARFFAFHGLPAPPALEGRAALLSPALGAELGAGHGDALVVLANAASDIPGSTLFGRRDEPGRRLRLTARGTLDRASMGEFALQPTAREVRAVFVPLDALQRALGLEGRANTLLFAGEAAPVAVQVAQAARLDDLGLRLRTLPGALALESASSLLDDETAARAQAVARRLGFEARPALIYLANAIRAGGERSVPYSLVAGLDDATLRRWTGRDLRDADPPPVVLNAWTARALGAASGARVTLEYYLWEESGRIATRTSDFTVAAVVPLAGEAADPTLVPDYPGITESAHLSDWDPPFPVDLSRIHPPDEEYWERHRTTPKAFVPLAAGQRLWGHRLGRLTSIRLVPPPGRDLAAAADEYAQALRADLLPAAQAEARLRSYGIEVSPVRARALAASRGSTDFGEYFLYFSAFLVVSALLLAGLFFRLGVEQRLAEVGLLRAVGFTPRRLLAQFVGEGALLALAGAALGTLGAVLYARLVMQGLRTVWIGAVGTRDLHVALSAQALLAGAAGGALAALPAVAWTLRDLGRRTPRALLSGALHEWSAPRPRGRVLVAASAAAAAAVLFAGVAGWIPPVAGFFGGGALMLVAALAAASRALRGRPRDPASARSLVRLGLRAASFRPGRSLVCIGLVAAAAFVIVAVGAFRHDPDADLRAPDSPSGGFTLLAASSLPLHHDPRTPEGRAALGLPEDLLAGATLARFRRADGEDASCLNLYRPGRPTVLGAEDAFLRLGRFAFSSSLAHTGAQRANPWLLLEEDAPGGPLPVVADATTLQYVLHAKLGEERALGDSGVRVRFVGALRPGLLQGELVTGERAFQRAFPGVDGYRFFLVDAPPGRETAVAEALESRLGDFGLDVTEAAAALRAYHEVENTYISTFQTLGALGLLLGTAGLGAVLLRNAFERRRELALLQAVGFRGAHLRRMVLSENALLLGLGLLAGLVPALVAILPALRERGGGLPLPAFAALLAALTVVGVATTLAAVAVVRRLPLLESLRSE